MAYLAAPPEVYWRYFPVAEFVERASYAGSRVPGRWTSFYRDVHANRLAGGDPWSQHLVGLAADRSPANAAFRDQARRAGLIALDEGTHDHVQGWPAGILEGLYA